MRVTQRQQWQNIDLMRTFVRTFVSKDANKQIWRENFINAPLSRRKRVSSLRALDTTVIANDTQTIITTQRQHNISNNKKSHYDEFIILQKYKFIF